MPNLTSIGMACNIYNDVNAVAGLLETSSQYFDDMVFYHAGPQGIRSNDGTIELLEKWKVKIVFGKIDEGFGAVRTAAVRACPTEWVMILDADERFHPHVPVIRCSGESTPLNEVSAILQSYDYRDQPGCPSNFENLSKLGVNLVTQVDDVYDQGAWLRSIIADSTRDAVCTIRRHWHDFTWKRPTQNWHQLPDYQIRLVRNLEHIRFDSSTKMHEQLQGVNNKYMPNQVHGPFFDHYHLWFKAQEKEQRRHDLDIYNALHSNTQIPTE